MNTLTTPDSTTITSSEPDSLAGSESQLLNEQKISEDDREEILQSIEQVVAQNRIPAGESLFRVKPLKKGFVFPLVINLIAAIAVAGGIVGANLYFSRQQATISNQAGTFFSAEGLIVAQLRKQSQQKLEAKDAEIASVKAKLSQLDQESAALKANMQSTIQAREQELQKQMQTQLAAEKARLQKLGIPASEVQSRLQAFEKQRNADFASQLDQYRKQSEAALQQKEQQIKAQQEQTRRALDQANQQRQQLQQQAQQQESQLRAQYEAQTKQLQSSNARLQARTTAAEQKLQSLTAEAQSEQLVSDQIVGSYSTILQDIQQARYDQAEKDIASLQSLLASPKIDSLPTIARRRPVDLEILGSLRELIKARTQPGQPSVDPAIVQKANQLTAAEKLVGEAQTAQKNGNATGAKELYTKAIAAVPVIQQAYSALMSLFEHNQSSLIAQREGTIAQLKQESAKQSSEIDSLTKRLSDTETALKSAQSEAADLRTKAADQNARIEALTKELAGSGGTAGDLRKQLAEAQTASDGYRKQLEAANASAESLKAKLADAESRIGKLQGELSDAQVSMRNLQSSSSRYASSLASIQDSYASFKTELTGLISSGTPQDIEKAQRLLLRFIDQSGVDTLLPGFSTVAGEVSNSSAKVAETKGVQTGRDGALKDVIKVTDYFSAPGGTAASSASTKAQIEQEAARDPLYRQAADDIQKLARQSGQGTGRASLSVKYQLIGTISYVSSNTITVEKLVNIPVPQGSTVIIQHKNAKGEEVPIAEGKVTSLSSDSVEVSVLSRLPGASSPQLLDVVYLTPGSGA